MDKKKGHTMISNRLAKIFIAPLIVFTIFAHAEDEGIEVAKLCASGNVEGHYNPVIGPLGKVDLYLVCLGPTRIIATFKWDQNMYDTLVYAVTDGDILTLSSFKMSFDEAGSNPGSGEPYKRIQLRISALKQGRLVGRYRSTQLRESLSFDVPRISGFPNLMADSQRQYGSELVGFYALQDSLPGLGYSGSVLLEIDIFGGTQRLALMGGKKGEALQLFMGMSATKRDVFYAGTGVRTGHMPFVHIRGKIIAPDHVEFYYFNTMTGMSGPFKANRVE